jgi:hypothetical protein
MVMTVRFNASKKDLKIIERIAVRAVRIADGAGCQYAERDAQMDLAACHCNGNPLHLIELLDADDFNFSHDVFGIRRHLDRTTGKLADHFLPRFAR